MLGSGVEAEGEGDQGEEEELAGPGHPVLHLTRYGGPHCSRATAVRYLYCSLQPSQGRHTAPCRGTPVQSAAVNTDTITDTAVPTTCGINQLNFSHGSKIFLLVLECFSAGRARVRVDWSSRKYNGGAGSVAGRRYIGLQFSE